MVASPAQLVFQGHNNLRYKITFATTQGGGQVTIPAVGGLSPDLITDTLAGTLKNIARAGLDGIGTVLPNTLTQAQARDILLADDSGASTGNSKVPRARLLITGRDVDGWFVDVNVDINHNPEIIVTGTSNGVAYLDVEFIGGIGP